MAANSGAENPIAVTLAKGINPRAATVRVCDTACERPRATWAPGLAVRNTARPWRGSMNEQHIARATAERNTMTSPTG